ncbi:protein phosphatase 2C domain-containing protein [Taklimakanibacter deserti]|uniref:protein phosphatase 2C domain-containing protein n=1 Tax=Taklimakanibacter deserti TaxID=2267839 RepID=UPI0013C4514C
MRLKLAGRISQGSGRVNEDAVGFIGEPDDVEAAWALDGVTGINDVSLGLAGSDAQWFVTRIDAHLRKLLPGALDVKTVMSDLVDRLIADQAEALRRSKMPDAYDPPAACIAALCRIGSGWHAVRLGDCRLLADDRNGFRRIVDFANDDFDHWITAEAQRLRSSGMSDIKQISQKLQPELFANRRRRNRPGGYGVIEADRACLAFVEHMPLTDPTSALMASDGFFRLVDHYDAASEQELLARAQCGEVADLYARLREIEASDPTCEKFPRFKPADDASAIALSA